MGTNIRQTDSGSMAFTDDKSSTTKMRVGGDLHAGVTVRKFMGTVGLAATTGGAILSWQNPENVPIFVDMLEIDVQTKSTGAAALSAGVAANGTTSSANLIDSYAIGATEKLVNNYDDKGTNGKSAQKMTTSQFLTISAAASTVGLVADIYVTYHTT